ncbi:hypothetical protein HEK616_01490 [Streptomyces nigrescens]|uniref:Transposase n=1 Tax=Streptomyces nigrescens TaxID=1920 RepID=A0ABN6QKE7_STRNI|nr:hypothetical protein HEK616_01490 [Streptomyces nigrescens]
MVTMPEQHMRCPFGWHEIARICGGTFRCDDHGVTVVVHDTERLDLPGRLDRVEHQSAEVTENTRGAGRPR